MGKARPVAGGGRAVEVEPARLEGWIERFERRNGGIVRTSLTDAGGELLAENGTRVTMQWNLDPSAMERWASDGYGARDVADRVAVETRLPRRIGFLLARKGAYSVAVVDQDGRFIASKTDTSYVQGRTKAGGQSQQRFARRRAEQEKAARKKATEAAVRILGAEALDLVVTGGVVDGIVDDPRLTLPETVIHFGDIGEPRRALVNDLYKRVYSLTMTIVDP
ncbi:acVLRF1 family peptidyl-tRNA hydrolase [Haloglycomyces albus]|uniref:acVLRF1 family peptidyl-tRNA hydrolase n=1 Tax=Haloglycomyces albus TaxID=526067 RepID=UPI00046C8F60|nr:acVLRF1 family peptidyl-tRNA hydrolase [Haloglycomyces albus]